MGRVLVIPDAHLKPEVIEQGLWLAERFNCSEKVMLGDYFDDWGALPWDYDAMIECLRYHLRRDPNIYPLYGNHEQSYLNKGGPHCSGYMREASGAVYGYLHDNMRFLYAIAIDNVLYTHAGVTYHWILGEKILTENERRYKAGGKKSGASLFEDKIHRKATNENLWMVTRDRGGHNAYSSPLWADMQELLVDHYPGLKQVVGHTPVREITMMDNLWFTDVRSNGNECDEYLLVIDGEPMIVHYNEEYQHQGDNLADRLYRLRVN